MVATNPGVTNLIAYWSLDEASGNAIDAHSTNDLTETSGTIASTTGKVGNARDFEAGDTEYFTRADNAALSMGNIAMSMGVWINTESQAGAMHVLGKWTSTGGREYRIRYVSATDRLQFEVSNDGTAGGEVNATTYGNVPGSEWIFVQVYHDPDTNLIGIAVNNGAFDTAAWTTGIFDGASAFTMGASNVPDAYFDGLIDEAFIYKRILTADEWEWLYNSGSGRAYSEIATTPQAAAGTITPTGALTLKAGKQVAGSIAPAGTLTARKIAGNWFYAAQPDDFAFAVPEDDWNYASRPDDFSFKA